MKIADLEKSLGERRKQVFSQGLQFMQNMWSMKDFEVEKFVFFADIRLESVEKKVIVEMWRVNL